MRGLCRILRRLLIKFKPTITSIRGCHSSNTSCVGIYIIAASVAVDRPSPPPPSSQVPYALAPGSAREARGQLKGFGEAFGGYGGAPCHRSEEFLSPGPLIIGGVGDSGYGTIGAATRGVESEYM